MFISGGENIHPEEIERALLAHPLISHAKVLSRPDPEFGARPTAFIATTLTQDEIINHLKAHLAKFKIPHSTEITLNPTNFLWTK